MKISTTIAAALMAVAAVAINAEHTSRRLILGGTPVDERTLNYTAGLRETIDGNSICGGALIASFHVLTTVSCTKRFAVKYVSLGTKDVNNTLDGEYLEVVSVYIHEEFEEDTGKFDFALLELASASKHEPITLPKADNSDVKVNMMATVAGWGMTTYPNGTSPSKLQAVELSLWSSEECAQVFDITVTNLCAGGVLNQDACEGDNGSPLIKRGDKGEILIGLVSWGRDCGTEDVPSVFSLVSSALSWIEKTIAKR